MWQKRPIRPLQVAFLFQIRVSSRSRGGRVSPLFPLIKNYSNIAVPQNMNRQFYHILFNTCRNTYQGKGSSSTAKWVGCGFTSARGKNKSLEIQCDLKYDYHLKSPNYYSGLHKIRRPQGQRKDTKGGSNDSCASPWSPKSVWGHAPQKFWNFILSYKAAIFGLIYYILYYNKQATVIYIILL